MFIPLDPTMSTPGAATSSAITNRTTAASHRRSVKDPDQGSATRRTGGRSPLFRLLASLVAASVPVLAALILYYAQQFDVVDLPEGSYSVPNPVPNHDARVLPLVERLAEGLLPGPEDFAYDKGSRTLYSGCLDGWIRAVKLGTDGSVKEVNKWAYVGGRPLGVALAPGSGPRRLYVANADLGLQLVVDDDTGGASSLAPVVTLLADEADGLRFALTDGVDVARDGTVYYTDASWKYSLAENMVDIMEGRPNGRLLLYDPRSNSTRVLLDRIYFANGVAVEPHGEFVVFCETVMRRCFRYYLAGAKEGQTDVFVDNLPGFPDNIRYDGKGSYWIAIPSGKDWIWDALFRYRWLRKVALAANKYAGMGNAGVLQVGLDGRLLSLRSDPKLHLITGGFPVDNYLYLGSLMANYLGRIRLDRDPE